MKTAKRMLLAFFAVMTLAGNASATERLFTYSYEPENLPQGGREFEQWITLATTRNETVGQNNYVRWDLREELEFGVTDAYTLALVWDEKVENFDSPADETGVSAESRTSEFSGFGIENKIMIWDPVEHPVGLDIYIEPHVSQDVFELEGKIILGQRFGARKDWKWAFNITHAAEWTEDFDKVEAELEFSAGVLKELNKRWSLGLEFRNHNEIPEYEEWENTVFYLGPVVSYRGGNWWATVTVMGQVYGKNYGDPDPDGDPNFELEGHEKLNARCIIGISF